MFTDNLKMKSFFICISFLFLMACSSTQSTDSDSTLENSSMASCGTTYDFFTHTPVEGALFYISPLGNLNPRGGHSFPSQHLYVHFDEHKSGVIPTKRKIYSPGNIKLIRVEEMSYLTSGKKDYSLNFGVCKETTAYFKHIKGLTDSVLTAVGSFSNCNEYESGGESIRRCDKEVSIDLSAGDELGHVGEASEEDVSFDFGIYDTRNGKLNFVNQTFYPETYYYLRCPLDYYSSAKKTELTAKLGGYDGIFNNLTTRTIAPVCGEVNQDKANTAQGNWIKQGVTSYNNEDEHLSFVHDNEVPTQGVVSIGAKSGVHNEYVLFNFIPTTNGQTKRQFADVTADNTVYCYEPESESISYHIKIKMTDNSTIQVEKGAGACPLSPTISSPITFVR